MKNIFFIYTKKRWFKDLKYKVKYNNLILNKIFSLFKIVMKNKVYFSHIPKTAGRTIEAIIYKYHSKDQDYVAGEGYFRRVIKKNYKYYYDEFLKKKYLNKLIKYNEKYNWNISFWHIPMSFWKNSILLQYKKEFNIFCIVRNPYDRAVSDFKYWIKFYNQQKNSKWKHHYYSLLREIEDIYDNNFNINKENLNNVIHKLYKTKKYEYALDGHLIPQYKYVYTIIDKKLIKIPNHVLYFEKYENEFKKFKNKYLPLISNENITETHLNPSQSNLSTSNLTHESKEILYQYFKIDFEAFHYTPLHI